MNIHPETIPEAHITLDAWERQAACIGTGDLMYPDEHLGDITAAKKVCGACPVRSQCLQDALTREDANWGVRGGFTARERRSILKKMKAKGTGSDR